MLFNSYIFIFLFLPLCLIGFYILQNRQATLAKVWLTCFSLWFYGYFNRSYLLIMICSILGNYLIHRWIVTTNSRKILITGVILNLAVLFYFKYLDFFIDNVNVFFGSSFPLKYILLPLGISFFTFQQISFLVDTYRGELDGVAFIDYALFVSFFPQLIAGPIVVHEEMIPQFNRIGNDDRSKEEKAKIFAKGVYVFVLGLAKKVLIADTFGIAVDFAYSNVNGINGFESLFTILFYSLQLYFDFSGYCDMAKGIAGMFGMRIANNFNSPYKAINIVDFWKRWHITLSRFFTKNIYIPLGGNRRGEGRMYLNYLIVFFLSGLWHGAGWNFILWGMMHGVLYVITKWWIIKRKTHVIKSAVLDSDSTTLAGSRILKATACFLTFIYVSIAWVYFRASDVAQANTLLMNIFTKEWALPGSGFTEAFNLGEFWYVLKILKVAALPYAEYYIMILFSAFAVAITFFGKNIDELAEKFKPTVVSAVITAVLFVWCVVSLSGVSTFLYFNF
ncbi:MAG: MBOAT family protein [Lachnospiraceae bacterium]|nr:MBOAT family protein [Lachnospiraceae bacterium]